MVRCLALRCHPRQRGLNFIRNDGVTGSNPVCGTNLLSIKSRTQKPKAHCHLSLGKLFRRTGKRKRAHQHLAHCHLSLGKLFRRTGKRKRAHQHLTTAAAMYREMGVRFWLEQAEAELRQLQ